MTPSPHDPRPRLRRSAEDTSATRVLLLHGIGAGVRSWDGLARHLPPHLELWDATLPWAVTGNPAWAHDPQPTRWLSQVVDDVIRATGAAPEVVVAHSFAANLLLDWLGRRHPLQDSGIVLLSPFYPPTGRDLDWSAVLPGLRACYARVAEQVGRRRGLPAAAYADDVILDRLMGFMTDHATKRFYEVCRRTPRLDLEALTVPALLVGGAQDELGASAEGVHALADRIPGARLEVLDPCGHFPMTERSADLAALIGHFIQNALHLPRRRLNDGTDVSALTGDGHDHPAPAP